ncbi:MAG: FAD-dependent thymidylate synthase [Nitrospira sp.]|nr:FAD-dependent thymidylate synthase [Candidatus Manganitrophaceae bacterium]HIL34855.1 FAD-dependent thymidylate synthase [Candidatus Manganitrophaceae bacterium]
MGADIETTTKTKEEERFLSPEPEVVLEKAFLNPFKNFVATAKTCYSSRGIIRDEEITGGYVPLAQSIYQAGHHTTLQHAHFQFTLSNVSRQFIWSFLHAHPFYNSEQVSQRYVTVKAESFAVPPLSGAAHDLYLEGIREQMTAYQRLNEMLHPLVDAEYARIFPRKRRNFARDVKKKSQEIARYVAPISAFAYLYHTISGITLLRYYRLCQQYDTPLEQRIVVEKMVQALIAFDPEYKIILQSPLPIETTPEHQFFESHPESKSPEWTETFLSEFDASLEGRVSRLIDYKVNQEAVLAQSVREILGVPRAALDDDDAIRLVLDPGKNRLLGESLNLTTVTKLSRALFHPAYTFRKKLSHTADSQDQRHRMTPGSRPVLSAQITDRPDYITPELIKSDPKIERDYDETMARSWDRFSRLKRLGVPVEYALYLLPNALSIRFTESADLLNLHHKHAMRLCYNAQEEIWRASLDEALQIKEVNPLIGSYLLPPCTLRDMAKLRPVCPEGERYCGVKVWKITPPEYTRLI